MPNVIFQPELVPVQISPEVFWSRYFFRIVQIKKQFNASGPHLNIDDDDEEELTWETESSPVASVSAVNPSKAAGNSTTSDAAAKLKSYEEENKKLKSQLKTLTNRITELETNLTNNNKIITELQLENQNLKKI